MVKVNEKKRSISSCSLKQTNIFAIITKWNKMEIEKHSRQTSPIIIEISSDSEDDTGYLSNIKTELTVPMPSDEESKKVARTHNKTGSRERRISGKRKLPFDNTSDEENSSDNQLKNKKEINGCSSDASKNRLKYIKRNRKLITHPNASSTPLKSSTPTATSSKYNLDDISTIISNSSDITSDTSDNTDPERTIITEQILPKKNDVNILQNVVIREERVDDVSVKDNIEKALDNKEAAKRNSVEERDITKNLKQSKQKNKENLNGSSKSKINKIKDKADRSNGQVKSNNNSKQPQGLDTNKTITDSGDKQQTDNTSKSENARSTETEKKVEQSKKNMHNEVKKNSTEDLSRSSKGTGTTNSESNNQPSCSKSIPNTTVPSLQAKKEKRKMNLQWLKLLTDLFTSVFKSNYRKNFSDSQKTSLKLFFSMEQKYQYLCLKLFCWQRKWYNIFTFCERIHLDMEDMEISKMYMFLKENKFIITSYTDESVINLLQRLDIKDLKSICDTFKIRKIKNIQSDQNTCSSIQSHNKKEHFRKDDLIENLIKICKTQSTLCSKSTEILIKEKIEEKMGQCAMLDEDFHNTLYMTYVLGTLSNSLFSNIEDYIKNILHLRVVFPLEGYGKDFFESYCIFYTTEEVISYVKARRYYLDLVKIAEKDNSKARNQNSTLRTKFNHVEYLQICKDIFKELKAIKDIPNENDERYKQAPHMIRFTAVAVYVKALSNAAAVLKTKFPEDVKMWLEYMIKKINFSYRIGEWYFQLSWLYMKYLQPFNYKHAAELIIEVLKEKSQDFSEVQLHKLGKRGQLLKVTRLYKIDQLYHDTIAEYSPTVVDIKDFSSTEVDAKAMRSDIVGKKRSYVIQGDLGNREYASVEYMALEHYLTRCDYTGGRHCEGGIILAMFTLFFWDIIYDVKTNIPGTFISEMQSMPLDMNTKYFYLNRKNAIDKRLKEIESDWSDVEVVKWLQDNYNSHSHKLALCQVDAIIENPILFETLVNCISRRVLSKIYERYVQNVRDYRSGLPDLLLWNADRKTSKFVEVKGENDTLSIGQKLWLKYLESIGADVQVCYVHSIGSKRRKRDGPKRQKM